MAKKTNKQLCRVLKFALDNLRKFALPAVKGRNTSVQTALRKGRAFLRQNCG
jgi:hypothetical protein